MLKNIFTLIFITLLLPFPVYALTLDLGIGANENTMFISDKQDLTDLGEISSDLSFYPTVSLKSDHAYFDGSNWGYFYELGASTLHLDKQGDPAMNVGTAIDGVYAHLTPTLFYNFDRNKENDIKTQVGIGIGLGYLDIQGDYITNKITPATKQNVSGSGIGFSAGIYFETQVGNWITRINAYGPVVDIGAYTYQYVDVTMSLTYRFYFEL